MTNWICAQRLPLDVNLAPVMAYLQARSVACWVSEEGGQQCIWLQQTSDAELLEQALSALAKGELQSEQTSPLTNLKSAHVISRLPPVTVALLLFSVLGALLVYFDVRAQWLSWLTFTDVVVRGNALYFSDLSSVLVSGQWWRLLSPMFLHFGLFHILFNSLWVWEMGRRIELRRSGLMLFGLTVFSGLAANILQYVMNGPSLFGGMSGVLYGYVGYILVWQRLWPSRGFGLPAGILGFMLIWLVLCFTGVVDTFIDGQVANGAHLGGLLGGLLFGFIDMLRVKIAAR
ncbi:rhomboid family intramembrane serine protease [Simiduia aestuariiviva]|uniref:GlpG protein n=1 Tax=Simiduia aestuariiviva TaxID=1510459 RepID=A0A839UST2_9GAMM|nr:rhomboid family intramembrane serine protease [Simiduia aestuariiviva]MBB3168558.1 GlpG protein [Simiduia aestuariiviva]